MDKNEFISLVLPLKDRLFREAWCILRSKEEAEDIVQDVQEQPLENIIRTEKMKLLYRMIDGLPGLQRDVVQLRDMEGLSYRDIAKTLQVTEEQVKVNLFRARKKIKTWILNMENYGL